MRPIYLHAEQEEQLFSLYIEGGSKVIRLKTQQHLCLHLELSYMHMCICAYVHCDYVQEYSSVSLLTVGSCLFLELKKETKTQS